MGHYLSLLIKLIEELHLDNLDGITPILWKIQTRTITEAEARRYLIALDPIIQERMRHPNVLPRPPSEAELFKDGRPEVELGVTMNGLTWGIRPLREVRHMLIGGGTGVGKSVLLRRLVIGLRKLAKRFGRNVVVVIIDPKRDFVDIRLISEGPWVVLDASSTLRWGNQRPRGVSVDSWVNLLCSTLASRMGVVAARITIAGLVHILIRLLNKDPQPSELWPSWSLVLDALNRVGLETFSGKADYAKSGRQMLTDAVLNSGQLLDTFGGFDVDEAVSNGQNVVIAVDQLTLPWLRGWLTEMVASHLFEPRLAAGRKTDTCEVVLVIDEADEFVSARQDSVHPLGVSQMGRLLKQAREFGIKCVLSVSVLKNISPFVISDCSDIVIFNQADSESIVMARHALMLPPEGDAMIADLRAGQCIVRQGLSNVPFAIRVDVDYVPPYRGKPLPPDRHKYIPAKSLSEMPELEENLRAEAHRRWSRACQKKGPDADTVSLRARHFLDLFSIYVYEPVAHLWSRLPKISASGQASVRKELTNKKIIAYQAVRIERRTVLIGEIQEKGWNLLGKDPLPIHGRGAGLVHRHFCQWIFWGGERRGYDAKLEWVVPGPSNHPVDVAWITKDGKVQAFEVVVEAESNILHHVGCCFEQTDAIETLTIVAAEKSQLRDIQNQIKSEPTIQGWVDRIQYETMETFVKELWP